MKFKHNKSQKKGVHHNAVILFQISDASQGDKAEPIENINASAQQGTPILKKNMNKMK